MHQSSPLGRLHRTIKYMVRPNELSRLKTKFGPHLVGYLKINRPDPVGYTWNAPAFGGFVEGTAR